MQVYYLKKEGTHHSAEDGTQLTEYLPGMLEIQGSMLSTAQTSEGRGVYLQFQY